jgi:hypothetical protein
VASVLDELDDIRFFSIGGIYMEIQSVSLLVYLFNPNNASGNVVVLRHSNAHSLGIAHLILWAPLLFALVKYEIKQDDFKFASIYGVWLSLLMITIDVSLVFDIRDIAMIGLGYK